MPRIKQHTRYHNFHFIPEDGVMQEQFSDTIILRNPLKISLLGKDAGSVIDVETIPANKTIQLVYGQVQSTHLVYLTPIYDDRVLAAPAIIYAPKDYKELVITVQTIKAVPTSEIGSIIMACVGIS